jgi:hypothetical protein
MSTTSEFMRRYRERVDAALKPHREIYGDAAPVVVMGLRLLAEAETLAAELENEMVTTAEAAERTGWHPETLQARARARLEGLPVPPGWEGLEAVRTAGGYLFRIGTIPPRP